jgi:hypothetical protein
MVTGVVTLVDILTLLLPTEVNMDMVIWTINVGFILIGIKEMNQKRGGRNVTNVRTGIEQDEGKNR